jgi:tol-pal system protein YbgF
MKIKTKLMIIGGLLVFILSGCATQKDMTSVDTRLTEMELRNAEARKNRDDIKYQVDEYSKMRESMDRELRRQSASLRALIEELREEIRILNGRLEEYDFALKQQQKGVDGFQSKNETVSNQLMETTAKNDQRIARLENYLNLESARKSTKVVPVVTPAAQAKAPKKLGEEEIYKLGKQAFDQGDSDTAKKHFQELIKRFPKSENADNAQFWIGEIYYREKWYEKAILEYQNVIEKFPKGNKVPAALLKQGLAFQNIGDKANSRLILEELIKKYPKTNEAKIAREKIKE